MKKPFDKFAAYNIVSRYTWESEWTMEEATFWHALKHERFDLPPLDEFYRMVKEYFKTFDEEMFAHFARERDKHLGQPDESFTIKGVDA